MPKTFDWKRLISRHNIFKDFEDTEIEALLEDSVSTEQMYEPNATILKEDDTGETFFLLGKGVAEVVLLGEGGEKTFISLLKENDFFGEIALFGQNRRSATVLANEPCIALEIDGSEFLKVVNSHPEVGVRILLSLGDRLRYTKDQAMAAKIKGLGDKLHLTDSRISTHLQTIDAYWEAVQTVIEQTNKRMEDMVKNTERERERKRWWIGTAITVIGTLVAVAGYLGWDKEVNPFYPIKVQQRILFEREARLNFDAERYKTSLKYFNKALDTIPREREDYEKEVSSYLAYLYMEACNMEQAKKYWSIYLEANPGDGDALYNLGVIHHLAGNYDSAISNYQAAIAKTYDHDIKESAYFNRGAAFSLKIQKDKNLTYTEDVIANLKESLILGKHDRAKKISARLESAATQSCDDVPDALKSMQREALDKLLEEYQDNKTKP